MQWLILVQGYISSKSKETKFFISVLKLITLEDFYAWWIHSACRHLVQISYASSFGKKSGFTCLAFTQEMQAWFYHLLLTGHATPRRSDLGRILAIAQSWHVSIFGIITEPTGVQTFKKNSQNKAGNNKGGGEEGEMCMTSLPGLAWVRECCPVHREGDREVNEAYTHSLISHAFRACGGDGATGDEIILSLTFSLCRSLPRRGTKPITSWRILEGHSFPTVLWKGRAGVTGGKSGSNGVGAALRFVN